MNRLTAYNVEQWISLYYENPQPELIPQAIKALRESGRLSQDSALETIAAFLSFILRSHPDRIDEWLSQFTDLSDEENVVIANALWFSDTEQSTQYLIKMSESAKDEMKEVFESLLTEVPPVMDEIDIIDPAILDMLWAAFMATGDEKYVARIISALPYASADKGTVEQAIGDAARWSVKSNAASQSKVMSIAKSETQKQQKEAASILREIIAEIEDA